VSFESLRNYEAGVIRLYVPHPAALRKIMRKSISKLKLEAFEVFYGLLTDIKERLGEIATKQTRKQVNLVFLKAYRQFLDYLERGGDLKLAQHTITRNIKMMRSSHKRAL